MSTYNWRMFTSVKFFLNSFLIAFLNLFSALLIFITQLKKNETFVTMDMEPSTLDENIFFIYLNIYTGTSNLAEQV